MHPGCKHKISVHKNRVMKVEMTIFPLICALTFLSGMFKLYHFIHINDESLFVI